jgi:hypothetical protein
MSLNTVISALSTAPELTASWQLADALKYITLASYIKPLIARLKPSYHATAPDTLSIDMHDFLKLSLGMKDATAKVAWATMQDIVWEGSGCKTLLESFAKVSEYTEELITYGLPRGIGMQFVIECLSLTYILLGVMNMYPPTRVCIDPECCRVLSTDPSVYFHREC